MKTAFSIFWFFLLLSVNGQQNFEQKIKQLHNQADTSFEKALKSLNKINSNALTNNEKAQLYWYKSIISDNADSVFYNASYYKLPNIAAKNKSLLLAAYGNYYLKFHWQPQKAKEYTFQAFQLYKNQPNVYSNFEKQYIISEYASTLFSLGKYNEAAEIINTNYQEILKMPCGNWLYHFLNDLILLNVVSNRPDIGMACSKKIAQCKPSASPLMSSIYNNLGQLNIYNGNYYQALLFQEKAKSNYDSIQQNYAYDWYWHMGWLNSDLGNYNLAESYYKQAEKMIVALDGNESYDYFLINLEKLKNGLRQNDTLSSLKIITTLEKIEKKSGIENDITTDFLELKGDYYTLKNQHKKALSIYKKALENRKKLAGNENFLILNTYKNCIKSLINNNQKDKALLYIKEAESSIKKHFEHATTHTILEIYSLKNQLSLNTTPEKIREYKALLQKSSYNFEWKKENYYQLAQLYFSEVTKNNNAEVNLKNAIKCIDSSYHYEQKTQLFQSYNLSAWQNKNDLSKIRDLGIKIALLHYNKNPNNSTQEKLFYYFDYSKYDYFKRHLLLLNKNNSNTISKLIQQEKEIRTEINSYYYSLEKGQNTLLLKKNLDSLNLKYEKILQQLSQESKSYYDYFVEMPVIKFKELQNNLDADEVFVSYTLLDNQLITLLISKNEFKIVQNTILLQPVLDNYFKAMKESNVALYKQSSFKLYEYLLKPIMPLIENKKMLVSLDAQLSGINLETLITKTTGNNFQELAYALYDIQPQYVVTGTSYILLNNSNDHKNGVTFIAPSFSQSKYIPQPFVQNWLNDFKKDSKNKIINPSEKKKPELLKSFQENTTTIVGTHTQIESFNPLESKIIMDPNRDEKNIKLSEILSMQNTSKLIILASCNTAKGQHNEGLGLLSIANGFSYAGSKSIICTLWEVDEQTTIKILKNLWNNTSNKSYNEKLQEAKKSILKNEHAKLSNPYYWGGIVIYGKDLQKTSGFNYYVVLLIGIAFVIIVILFKKTILSKLEE